MLGQQVTYTRRKRTSQCFNGEQFERPTVKKKCSCTQADYFCEVGFTRNVGSTECIFGGVELMPERFAPTVCRSSYASPAYRKVPGNLCEGGWTPPTVEVPCPGMSFRLAKLAKWSLFLLFALGASYVGYTRFSSSCAGRPKNVFGDVSGGSRNCVANLPSQALLAAAGCCGLIGRFCMSSSAKAGYEKLKGDDFDMDGARESLSDFLDEAYDDDAPREYSGVDDKKSRALDAMHEEPQVVTGAAARYAREQAVPRLQAPPAGGGPQTFDMASNDEDLL